MASPHLGSLALVMRLCNSKFLVVVYSLGKVCWMLRIVTYRVLTCSKLVIGLLPPPKFFYWVHFSGELICHRKANFRRG
jgi:hypothetical protein